MISDICKIDKGTKDLAEILKQSEKVALYNGLDKKQTLQLSLICEEIDGMLPNIVADFDGDFWIEYEEGVCKVNALIDIKELISRMARLKKIVYQSSNRKKVLK